MGPISNKRAEWLNAKYFLFSLLFVGTLRPLIESAPALPNRDYHTVGVDTFRFRFPSEKSHFDSSEKGEELVSKKKGGVTKLLHHNIHPTMINSTSSTEWMKNVVSHSLEGDKNRANAIIAASSKCPNQSRGGGGGGGGGGGNGGGNGGGVPVVSGNAYGTNFIVSVRLGTPPKEGIMMNFDTANDVSWLQCNDRDGSSSYRRLSCNSCNHQVEGMACNRTLNQCIYKFQYHDGEKIEAHMSEDTFWFGSEPIRKFAFGCGRDVDGSKSDPSIGLLAFGRNSLSLPSQTEYLYQRKFSYCLPDFLNPRQKGWLTLGFGSVPPTSKFTTLLSNPWASSWYFVGLRGISVGGKRLKISPDVFQFHSRGGGTMIDSGVLISRLVKPAYNALRDAFVEKMTLAPLKPQSQNPLDTCFSYPGDVKNLIIPGITFHFQDGAHIHIHKHGILTPVSENVICLAFEPADRNDLSIIGSLQQQHFIVSFDERHQRVGFSSVRTCIDPQ